MIIKILAVRISTRVGISLDLRKRHATWLSFFVVYFFMSYCSTNIVSSVNNWRCYKHKQLLLLLQNLHLLNDWLTTCTTKNSNKTVLWRNYITFTSLPHTHKKHEERTRTFFFAVEHLFHLLYYKLHDHHECNTHMHILRK